MEDGSNLKTLKEEILEKWQTKIDGREYPFRTSKEEQSEMEADGVVVVYWDSDDRLEFEGALYEEFDAWEGVTVYFSEDGFFLNDCEQGEDCPNFTSPDKETTSNVEAVWSDTGEPAAWTLKVTGRDYLKFRIMKDDKPQSIGAIFLLEKEKEELRCKTV